MQIDNSKRTLKLSWLFYVNQFQLIDIIVILFMIISLFRLISSLPKPEPIDPLDHNNYPFKIIELGRFNNSLATTFDVNDDGNSEIIGFTNTPVQ